MAGNSLSLLKEQPNIGLLFLSLESVQGEGGKAVHVRFTREVLKNVTCSMNIVHDICLGAERCS